MGGSIYEGNRIKLKGQGRNYFINHTVEREIAVDKHKLLILGSDFVTISVVKEAKKLGIYVIVADLMQNSPTKEEADEAWLISTTDIDLLEQKCKEEEVTAIMFGASDFNIENARVLCRRLNLPIYCDNDSSWKAARNKSVFKEICKQTGAPVAKDYYITDNMSKMELDSVEYPVVVKPVDKSGNRGMSYCHNQEQLVAAYKKAREISDNERIIVEQCLSGVEYNINYVCADGEIRLLSFSRLHHQPGQLSNLYSFEMACEYHLKQYLEEVNDYLIAAFKKANCRDGIVWVDAIRDENDGKFYLLEMGYRFPGALLHAPYCDVTGFSTVKWMLECSLGVKHRIEDMPQPLNNALGGFAASIHLFTNHEGKVGRIDGLDELIKNPNIYIDMPKREGGFVREYACMGLIGIYAKDFDELCKTIDWINSTLKITDENGENLLIYFNDYETLRKEHEAGIKEFQV